MPELFAGIEEIPVSAFEATQRLSSTVGEIGSLVEAIATPQPQLRDYVQPRLICGRAVCRASGGNTTADLRPHWPSLGGCSGITSPAGPTRCACSAWQSGCSRVPGPVG